MAVEPRPVVKLVGTDGNAFSVVGKVRAALQKAGCSKEHCDRFVAEAFAGDYDHVLQTAMKFADVR